MKKIFIDLLILISTPFYIIAIMIAAIMDWVLRSSEIMSEFIRRMD